MTYKYDYPRPMVTVDIVVLAGATPNSVLLIKRKNNPYSGMWALPGGFVDMDESLENAALRELNEETGIRNVHLFQFAAYGEVNRDPRGRNIAIVYFTKIDEIIEAKGGDDAAEARWFNLSGLPELAFDHKKIIADVTNKTK